MTIYDDFLKPQAMATEGLAPSEYGFEAWEDEDRYIYRLSASGYLDCTEWCTAFTLVEAVAGLVDMYYQDADKYDVDSTCQWFHENWGIDMRSLKRVIV